MRRKLVAGNWKMNLTATEGVAVVDAFVRAVDARSDVDVVLCPSAISIPKIRDALRGTHIAVGAQDVFWEEAGAFTGEISAAMLVDAGATWCILGHSETRGRFGKLETSPDTLSYFAESERTVSLKLTRLLFHAITPILCVGETLTERSAGDTETVIEHQLSGALDGIDPSQLHGLVVAYEPVWAIGTGQTCEASEASRVCAFIRGYLSAKLGADAGQSIRVLYGGSVKASNSRELFAQEDIDGGLVGGASLNPTEFAEIVASA